jgi:hypothetical protein
MGRIWNIVRTHLQDIRRNSDTNASADSVLREKFSSADSRENFIRVDLS